MLSLGVRALTVKILKLELVVLSFLIKLSLVISEASVSLRFELIYLFLKPLLSLKSFIESLLKSALLVHL